MIVDMGFTPAQGRKALLETVRDSFCFLGECVEPRLTVATQGGDPNRAVEWLFSHPDDDGTVTADASASSATKEPLGSSSLPAKYRLKTFISHKGPSVHSGHYVSHVWTGQADESGKGEGSWVLFNDEKVVRAGDGQTRGDGAAGEWMEKAYVYLFERTQ